MCMWRVASAHVRIWVGGWIGMRGLESTRTLPLPTSFHLATLSTPTHAQREIVRLNADLDNLRKGFADPAIEENKELRERMLQ